MEVGRNGPPVPAPPPVDQGSSTRPALAPTRRLSEKVLTAQPTLLGTGWTMWRATCRIALVKSNVDFSWHKRVRNKCILIIQKDPPPSRLGL